MLAWGAVDRNVVIHYSELWSRSPGSTLPCSPSVAVLLWSGILLKSLTNVQSLPSITLLSAGPCGERAGTRVKWPPLHAYGHKQDTEGWWRGADTQAQRTGERERTGACRCTCINKSREHGSCAVWLLYVTSRALVSDLLHHNKADVCVRVCVYALHR